MSFVGKSSRRKPRYDDINDSSLSKHEKILSEEVYYQKQIKKLNNKKDKSVVENDDKRIKRKELTLVDIIERLILDSRTSSKQFLEATSNKPQRRQSSTSSTSNSYQIDKLLQDENNDWFFEKILEKFEDIRSKKLNQYARSSPNDFDNDVVYSVERIIERRYYVKKPKLVPRRDQITSTSDLIGYKKKNRQLSGVSTVTEVTTCSQCSTLTPTYVENLREQSDSLRNQISELRDEIEQLQTSQQQFFQQLQTHFQSKPTSSNSAPSTISPIRSSTDKNGTSGTLPVPLTTTQLSRSTSTESMSSSSATSSKKSTPIRVPAVKPITTPSKASIPPPSRPISEFIAYKNPSYAPAPTVNTYANSKSPSIVPTLPVNAHTNSKPPSVPRTPSVTEFVASKSPMAAPIRSAGTSVIASTPPAAASTGSVGSKTSSVVPTPPAIAPVVPIGPKTSPVVSTSLADVPIEPASAEVSSGASTPSIDASSLPSARIPIYENELAHRRVLSPRSQIVASSASIQDSSDSSSESVNAKFIRSNPQKNSKVPVTTLRDNDMQDLARYSSQLELSGFPPSTTAILTDPNTSSTFWDSVDQYIENSRLANIYTELPPISLSNNGSRFGLNNFATKQLDKYDLEIKPQEFIGSSAPFLMPPLDILP